MLSTKEVISAHTIVETYMQTRKNSTETATKKRFEMIHTPEESDIEVVINTCDMHMSDGDVITYSHSKQTSNIFTSSTNNLSNAAAIITPQISKTSQGSSRRTSSKYMKDALELLNINISNREGLKTQ